MKDYSHIKNTSTRDLIVAIRAFLSDVVGIREYLKEDCWFLVQI